MRTYVRLGLQFTDLAHGETVIHGKDGGMFPFHQKHHGISLALQRALQRNNMKDMIDIDASSTRAERQLKLFPDSLLRRGEEHVQRGFGREPALHDRGDFFPVFQIRVLLCGCSQFAQQVF